MRETINIVGDLSDDGKTIILEQPVKGIPAGRVHLVLIQDDEEISDQEWVSSLSKSNLYDDLKHPDEDIYSINDGKPYYGTR